MAPELELVIKLHALDTRIAELGKEVAALPRHIATIEKTLESHVKRLEADRAALAANQKERRHIDGEFKVQEQKISKLRDQMLEAKTNEQYRAFQHEIAYCEQIIRKHEDRVLELMLESESLEQNVQAAETALAKEKADVEAEKEQARERTAADKEQLEQLRAERAGAVASLGQRTYTVYEKIRKKFGGTAVAEATNGLCSACHLELRPQFFQDLRKGEQLMYCENCRRILYYNPPVAFDDQIAPAPASGTPSATGGM